MSPSRSSSLIAIPSNLSLAPRPFPLLGGAMSRRAAALGPAAAGAGVSGSRGWALLRNLRTGENAPSYVSCSTMFHAKLRLSLLNNLVHGILKKARQLG